MHALYTDRDDTSPYKLKIKQTVPRTTFKVRNMRGDEANPHNEEEEAVREEEGAEGAEEDGDGGAEAGEDPEEDAEKEAEDADLRDAEEGNEDGKGGQDTSGERLQGRGISYAVLLKKFQSYVTSLTLKLCSNRFDHFSALIKQRVINKV